MKGARRRSQTCLYCATAEEVHGLPCNARRLSSPALVDQPSVVRPQGADASPSAAMEGQHVRKASAAVGDRRRQRLHGQEFAPDCLCRVLCRALLSTLQAPQPPAPFPAVLCSHQSRSPDSGSARISTRRRLPRRSAPPRLRNCRASSPPTMMGARRSAGTFRARLACRDRRSAATCCVIWSSSAPLVRAPHNPQHANQNAHPFVSVCSK